MSAGMMGLALGFPIGAVGSPRWRTVMDKARGQRVLFSAWAGDQKINAYIAWAGWRLSQDFDIELVHVKITDTAASVRKVLTEKALGSRRGSSDIIWSNGSNFKTMKEAGLLYGPFAEGIPNYRFTDYQHDPTLTTDFTVPTQGFELPWGRAQLVMIYDSTRVAEPPGSFIGMLEWAKSNPGRFSYPLPPDFTGVSFLKQTLLELTLAAGDELTMFERAPGAADYDKATSRLWAWLDQLHLHAWQKAANFPSNYPAIRSMLSNNVLDFAMAYNPNEAATSVIRNILPNSIRSYVSDYGSLANTHFLAITFNAGSSMGALVTANFLLSPEAQARKADLEEWGDPTVLSTDLLEEKDRLLFNRITRHPAQPSEEDLKRRLPEPHPLWGKKIKEDWLRRYGLG